MALLRPRPPEQMLYDLTGLTEEEVGVIYEGLRRVDGADELFTLLNKWRLSRRAED